MTKAEADGLVEVLKNITSSKTFYIPPTGSSDIIELASIFNKQDWFLVDVNKGFKINTKRYTLQLRHRKSTILLRMEYGGPSHRNPDGEVVPCPHMHIWSDEPGAGPQGTGFAYPIPVVFSEPSVLHKTLREFLNYTNARDVDSLRIIEQMEANN